MTSISAADYCPEEKLSGLLGSVAANPQAGMRDLVAMLREYPLDARLHFLNGSLLAGQQDFMGARTAMRRAVDLAPDYAVARFQLGFLLLTSGEPHAAQEAWGPLHSLPKDSYIQMFVKGLCHLIKDEFDEALEYLHEGIARNAENPPMNRDMQMIIDEVRAKSQSGGHQDSPASSVDFLLQQSNFRPMSS